jgi:hypothetical protein
MTYRGRVSLGELVEGIAQMVLTWNSRQLLRSPRTV